MKIIFLDIDGVICPFPDGNESSEVINRWKEDSKKLKDTNPFSITTHKYRPVDNLKRLCKETGAKIVISSSWRRIYDREKIIGFFKAVDFGDIEIIGETPTYCSTSPNDGREITYDGRYLCNGRAEEINYSIQEHNPTSYVILDDTNVFYAQDRNNDHSLDSMKAFFIQTDHWHGLTSDDVEIAIKILNGADNEY